MSEIQLVPFTVESISPQPNSEIPDGVTAIQAPTLWSEGYKGKGVIVAVIDTGVDDTHPDLQGQVIGGYNFTTEGAPEDYKDENGHGTHVSGTIAAKENGSGVVGVAPEAKILAVKVLGKDGSGYLNAIVQGINYAVNWTGSAGEKVNVISMSLGAKIQNDALHTAVKNAVDNNIVVVVAAGNAGDGNAATDELAYPGSYDEVVSVGACDTYGHVADFSNSNNEVDLVAPGVSVNSTYLNGQYAVLSGTSMAAPHVSGAAALIVSEWKDKYTKKILESELYAQIVKRTFALDGYDPKEQGNGMLILTTDIPLPTLDDITFEEAVNGLVEADIVDTPTFWLNLNTKYKQGTLVNSDFKYLDLLIRKFYLHLL